MRKFTFSIIFIFFSLRVFAQDSLIHAKSNSRLPDSTKTYTASRIEKAPRIDGVLDDAIWQSIPATNTFTQNVPIEGRSPKFKTEVKIGYDNFAVYVSAMLYDDFPDSIPHELGKRDDGGLNADFFRFVIDPYDARHDAYDFGVYASGVQVDSKFSDPTFDAVWESATKINSKGWCVEIKIPYSAIRFPKKPVQEWGLQLTRSAVRNREFDQWCLTPKGSANPQRFWGRLLGINKISPPLRLSLSPYLSAYYIKTPEYNSDGTYKNSNSFSYNIGADIKYGIDDRFTLDMTLFPDFGQVQTDSKVKNLGYREVTYDENRSFFKEGTELFTKGNLFYSRRIGKIPTGYYSAASDLKSGETLDDNPSQVKLLNATKLSGRTDKGLGVGILNAVTANMYATIRDSTGKTRKILTEPSTNYNIVVLDQQLKNNSGIYFINTNVTRAGHLKDANVSAVGMNLNDKKNTYAFTGNGTLSQKFSGNDSLQSLFKNELGYKYELDLSKISGNFQWGAHHEVFNNKFDSRDMGYYLINNYKSYRGFINYSQFQPNRAFRNAWISLASNYSVNYLTNERIGWNTGLDNGCTFLNYFNGWSGFGFAPFSSLDYNEPRVPDRYYRSPEYGYYYLGMNTDARKKIIADVAFTNSFFFRNNIQNLNPTPGYDYNIGLKYRVSNRLSISFRHQYSFDPYNVGFVTSLSDSVIFGARRLNTFTNTFSVKYIFKNDMLISLDTRHYWSVGEYKNYFVLNYDGYLMPLQSAFPDHSFNYNAFSVDLVFSWKVAPGSFLNIVYKKAIESEKNETATNYNKNLQTTLADPQTNSLSVKLLYYLDYLYLRKR